MSSGCPPSHPCKHNIPSAPWGRECLPPEIIYYNHMCKYNDNILFYAVDGSNWSLRKRSSQKVQHVVQPLQNLNLCRWHKTEMIKSWRKVRITSKKNLKFYFIFLSRPQRFWADDTWDCSWCNSWQLHSENILGIAHATRLQISCFEF